MTGAPLVTAGEGPSERDEAIFRAAVVDGRSRAELARLYGLSVSRVQWIVRQVERYYALRLVTAEGQTRLVVQKLRLEHLYSEALAGWYRSQQAEETMKQSKNASGETRAEVVRRSQSGDVKFLEHARRLLVELERVHALLAEREGASDEGKPDVENLSADERRNELVAELLAHLERTRAKASDGADLGPPPAAKTG